jgi:hypothetical protein
VFYYIGKIFCIRGGEEQRKLGPSQLVRSNDPLLLNMDLKIIMEDFNSYIYKTKLFPAQPLLRILHIV